MTTMKDVAQIAGVSVATVSRVINDNGFVSTELRERVQFAMSQLNYHPSNVARSLRRQQTQSVAVMVPHLNQLFFSTLTFAIQQRLFQDGYYTLTCSTEDRQADEAAYTQMLLSQRVDGVIVAPTGHSAYNIQRLIEANIPVILVDRQIPGLDNIDRVLFDNEQGGYLGATHLLELGHKHISIIGTPAHSPAIMQRLKGAQKALQNTDVQLQVNVLEGENLQEFDAGYQLAKDQLNSTDRPTAIFALTDNAAVGVAHAASESGFSLPRDLSIMGFDNIPLARYVFPPLSTIAQPIHQMGQQTAEVLLNRLQDKNAAPTVIVNDAKLVLRGSTQAPSPPK